MFRLILLIVVAVLVFKYTNIGEVMYTGASKGTEYIQQNGVKGVVDSVWCGQTGCKDKEGSK